MAGQLDNTVIHQVALTDTGGVAAPLGTSTSPGVAVNQGGGTIATAQTTVAATATLISAARSTRNSITITNHGTTDVFIGLAGVTTTTGILLQGVKGTSITLITTAAVYGIVAAATQVVSSVEVY